MSLKEYFEFDRNSEANYEYFDGEVFEMSGVSPNHATIETLDYDLSVDKIYQGMTFEI